MRLGILTSSRADYGIYHPLLARLKLDNYFSFKLIVFGTHLSDRHGLTYREIESDGHPIHYKLNTVPKGDSSFAIATAIGETIKIFSEFWEHHGDEFDIIFCLGDRYEMFAAVMSGIPFQLKFAHLHGGETTLGAIDNIFRHGITLSSKYHFASTTEGAERIKELIKSEDKVYNVGALSLDNLQSIRFLTVQDFNTKWGIDLSKDTILTTFHPETIALERNGEFAHEVVRAIKSLKGYQVLITMPNADTSGMIIRDILTNEFKDSDNVFLIENLGSSGYFTALKFCSFLIGNTSSGIIEAASFGKYVIDLGDRQNGRACGNNVIHVPIVAEMIKQAVKDIKQAPVLDNENIYFNGGAAEKIIQVLKFDEIQ
jgi:GDP/UDP-N,N'-diacetylbacillosamine 2-epimerase (hydrolysing)